MKNKYLKGISANILLLGIVSSLNDLSSEMIIPILPMFITSLGGAGTIVGLIGGLQESISSILKVLSGYWSDRVGRRKIFVSSGYLTSAAFKLLLSFSWIWQHVLLFVSFERVGKGLRTAPRDAIIADSMPEARGKGFGIHRALDTLGAIAGSVVVLLLLWFFWFDLEELAHQVAFYKSTIFIAAIIAFISLLPLYFVKDEKREPQKISLQISLRRLPKPVMLFIMVATVFALANFTYMFFILKAKDAFTFIGTKESIALAIFLYILFNIFYAVLALPFGTLSDRIGKRGVLISGYLLFSVTCLGFAIFNSLPAFLVLFPLYGMVYAMVDGNQRAFISDLSAGELRATALGTFHTMTGIVRLPASLIAGFLWNMTPTHSLTFLFGTSVSIVAVLLFVLLSSEIDDGFYSK
ncbi:MAG: MFS transporter [Candidatus Methanospirareceae archaeon]